METIFNLVKSEVNIALIIGLIGCLEIFKLTLKCNHVEIAGIYWLLISTALSGGVGLAYHGIISVGQVISVIIMYAGISTFIYKYLKTVVGGVKSKVQKNKS